MQWKVSSSLATIASLLLFAGDLAVAQISAPLCLATSTWLWTYNSLDQSPCMVTAYLLSTCYGGSFTMNPLGTYIEYAGPSATEVQQAGPCWCNTVAYSLMSACSECQGGQAIAWSQYEEYCKTVQVSAFPHPVPAGTRVPHWALVAISGSALWNPSTAKTVGDAPEILPGGLINGPAVVPTPSTAVPTPNTVAPPPTTPIVPPAPTVTVTTSPSTTAPPFSAGSKTGGSKQVVSAGGLVWGVTSMAAISGLVLTLIPRLV